MRRPKLFPVVASALALFALFLLSSPADAGNLAGAALNPALLEVTVNGTAEPEPVLLLADDRGGLYAPAEALTRWRLRPQGQPIEHGGETYYAIAALDGVTAQISQLEQTVRIEALPSAFVGQSARLAQSSEMAMTVPGTGAYLNYDIQAERVRGATTLSGGFDLGLFTRHGVGDASFIAQAGAGRDRLTRLETGWTIDWPEQMTSLRLGDAVSFAPAAGAPIRFAGLQYGRNFAVQPGFITLPLPEATGDASLPSVAEIYADNVLQGSQAVAPGPFSLTDIPVRTGGGTVQVVVRDMLGRSQVIEQSYYTSTQLLRRGLHDFSYETGFIRRGFGRLSNRYGSFMAATTHRYGFSSRLTGEAHVEATGQRQMMSASLAAIVPVGLATVSAAASRSGQGPGFQAGAGIERSTSSFSLGARGEYASAHFTSLAMPRRIDAPRLSIQAFADAALPRGGIGLNLFYRDLRGAKDESLVGLSGSWRLSGSASLQLYARRSFTGPARTAFGLNLAFGLGGRRSLSANVEHRRGGASGALSFQQDAPSGTGGAVRALASFGPIEAVQGQYVRNLASTSLSAEVAYARKSVGIRLGARGAIGLVGGTLFASRSLGDSFAILQMEDQPGARVYADNHLVGTTDRNGRLAVPNLRAYETNLIRIDEADLPMDVQLAQNELALRPYRRSGNFIRFTVRRERGVLMQVRLEDGSVLPAGAAVHFAGRDEPAIAVSGGEIYVPDMPERARARATWPGGSCEFFVEVPANDDPQPLIENLVCHDDEIRFATR